MAPPCTGQFGYAALKRIIHHATGARNVQMCGLVAMIQLRGGRHHVIEQPAGSAPFRLAIWQHITHAAFETRFDQCRFGLRGARTGMLIRKRTD